MKILITGATGNLGRPLLQNLQQGGAKISAIVRPESVSRLPADVQAIPCYLSEASPDPDLVGDQDVLIHLAASAPHTNAKSVLSESPTVKMAQHTAQLSKKIRIKRNIVVSSIAASIAESDSLNTRKYGIEKSRADIEFERQFLKEQNCIFIRPAAIYGPGIDSPISKLAKLIERRIPLPVGMARNPRPYLFLDTFIEAVTALINADENLWRDWHFSKLNLCDERAISTRSLVEQLSQVLLRPSRIWCCPWNILSFTAQLFGSDLVQNAFEAVEEKSDSRWPQLQPGINAPSIPDTFAYMRHEASQN
ncbi:NAD-dependent epimerase/dehydratase family protein [Cognatishimia sp. 1_MG-2023]|uniref:NAD-dependent epimerase/dehydratase family protein n=1 Tax=Cognatishimia sp. 1_MG-2023 TaxID=3062642 RepID=UPI0026E42230|nr:NAD-dependent epimerase/dehydratase family protein [Cognatishimia sp. 1_MG-2023]MDO6728346.1 NAD-dependent epimerase/dehydratase family protein [Cognatishimia sp. 1_MG-2023]